MSAPSTDQPVTMPTELMADLLERHNQLTGSLGYVGSDETHRTLRSLFIMCTENLGGSLEVKPHVEG